MHETVKKAVEGELYGLERFRFLFTLAIGLGFATTTITWTHYNGTMIGFIETNFKTRYPWLGATFISFIMTWDNIIAIFLQPWIGAKSDNIRTRFGKRTPYIMVGVPLAAIFFALIPWMKDQSLIFLVMIILCFNISMAIYRSPVVALMPDLTPSQHRTKGNALINLMGGLFAGVALFVAGGFVKNKQTELSFAFVSVVMVVALIAFLALVREPKELKRVRVDPEEVKEPVYIRKEFRMLFQDSDKSKLFILLSIAAWFIAWNALEIWLPPYIAVEILGHTPGTKAYLSAIGEANQSITLVPILFVVSTLPGGYLGFYFGRKPVIRFGILLFIFAMAFGMFQTEIGMIAFAMMIAGISWGLINVNSIVIVWELSKTNIGAGTGLYYLASSFAAILGPIIFGVLIELTNNYYVIWYFTIFFLSLAFLFMFMVISGEIDADGEKIGALDAMTELD